VVKERRKRTN